MPTTDTTVNNLIINKLTKAQYDLIQNPSDTELYLVPDEIDNVPTSGSDNPVKSGGVYSALGDKQDTLVFNTAYNASSNKVATMADVPSTSNFVQKSSTSGLLKNDGTVDTSTYLTQHQDISNYIQKSNTSGLMKNDGTIDTTAYTTNTGTVTSVTVNGSTYNPTNGDVDLGTIGGGGGSAGNLDTTATTSQATSSSESLSGNVTLHKVSKTGAYTDLVNAPQYVICTLSDYNSMASHDANTYYLIVENNA